MRFVLALIVCALTASAVLVSTHWNDETSPADLYGTQSTQGWMARFKCDWLNQCDQYENMVARFQTLQRGSYRVNAQLHAEAVLTPENQRRAEAILECSYEDFARHEEVEIKNPASQSWVQGEAPPAALLEAAEGGDAQALWELGFQLAGGQAGDAMNVTEQEAFEYVLRAADLDHPLTQAEAGAAYLHGYWGQDIDTARAREYLRAAVDNGDTIAMLSLSKTPPADGQSLEAYAAEKLDLELQSATACYEYAAIQIAARLYTGDRGLQADPRLANHILDRVGGQR